VTNPLESIRREWALFDGLQRTLAAYKGIDPNLPINAADDFERSVDRYRDHVAFRFEGQSLTYRDFEARANRYAHWALGVGLKPGDCVALMMTNRPDYVACWAGLLKVGVSTALINTNLTGAPLAHCIAIVKAEHVIVSADLRAAIATAQLDSMIAVWAGDTLDGMLAQSSDARPDRALRAFFFNY